MKTHQCPIPECDAQIPDAHLMCKAHWHCVPHDLQRHVNECWRGFQARKVPAAKLQALRLYRGYSDAAVQAVINHLSPVQ